LDSQSVAYLDTAYRIFTGTEPHAGMHARAKCIAVMASFDGRKLNDDERLERVVRAALCVVGLHWHASDGLPYGWDEIAERIRELTPALGEATVDAHLLRQLLQADRGNRMVVSSVRR
jgi:hypothetical protein